MGRHDFHSVWKAGESQLHPSACLRAGRDLVIFAMIAVPHLGGQLNCIYSERWGYITVSRLAVHDAIALRNLRCNRRS